MAVVENLSKFYKNLILCGEIDYYCLLCCEFFKNSEEIEKHIRWEKHRKAFKLQANNYLPKFKKESIHKVQKYFYCELCNFITEDNSKITEHINGEEHSTNKENPNQVGVKIVTPIPIRGTNQEIIIGNNNISFHKWMGLVGGHCIICDTAVKNTQEHLATMTHMISIIQSQIIKYELGYYRKMDSESFHCFDCNKKIPMQDLESHAATVCESLLAWVSRYFDINMEKNEAKCTQCGVIVESISLDMLQHKSSHGMTDLVEDDKGRTYKLTDHGKRRKELKEYGAPNFIKLNRGGGKGYCLLCDIVMSAHMNVFQSHVNGARHTANLEIKGLIKKTTKSEKPRYKTKQLQQYLKNIVPLKSEHTVWINGEFGIGWGSFVMMCPYPEGKKFKCYVCTETLTDYKAHLLNKSHNEKLLKVNVISAPELDRTEFIREVLPSLYHCGHCNSLHPSWYLLNKHLRSTQHLEMKWEGMQSIEHAIVCDLQHGDNSITDVIDSCHEDFLL